MRTDIYIFSIPIYIIYTYIHNEGYDEEKDKASFGYHFTRGGPWVEGQDCSNINHLHYYNAEKGMLERDGEIKL